MIEVFVNSSFDYFLLILVLIVWVVRKVLRVLIAPEIIMRMMSEILKESRLAIVAI